MDYGLTDGSGISNDHVCRLGKRYGQPPALPRLAQIIFYCKPGQRGRLDACFARDRLKLPREGFIDADAEGYPFFHEPKL